MKYTLMKISDGFEWKIVASIVGTIISYLEGFYTEMLWSFLAFYTLDFITGIMKSKRKGIPIVSKRLRDSVSKLGSYMILITALIIAGQVDPQFVPLVTLAYYYFIFTEFKSIIENVEEMGVKVPGFLKSKVEEHHNRGNSDVQVVEKTTEDKEDK